MMAGVHFSALFLVLSLAWMAPMARAEGCRVADAALRYDDINYIFVGLDYIKLDDDNKEESIHNKNEEWGGLERLDASMNWKDGNSWYNSWYPVFFEGSSYYYYSYSWSSTYGPYPVVGDDSPFPSGLNLEKGVDAAATVGDKSYLMKCCDYIVYDHEEGEIESTGTMDEFGLPCDVHAALELREGILGVIKHDQLWEIDSNKNVTGPLDANTALGLESIKLCDEHDDAGESFLDDSSDSSDDDSS